jgi:hypothetical protein
MATPKRRKADALMWQPYPGGLQCTRYNGALIIKRKSGYSAEVKKGISFSAKSLHDAKTAIDAYKRSKEPPPFEWQFHHPVEGWYYASFLLGAIKKDRYENYTYTTDRRNWRKARNFEDAKQKIRTFSQKWAEQWKK